MAVFLIVLIINLGITGIFYMVYGRKKSYSEGMLLGVHIPESAAESEEIREFMKKYRKRSMCFYLVNGILCLPVSALCFLDLSCCILVWMVWLTALCCGAVIFLYYTHRKLYDLKMERGWIGSGGGKMIPADMKAAVRPGSPGLSPWWHLVCLLLILMPGLLPGVRAYLRRGEGGLILLGTGIFLSAALGIVQGIILRAGERRYSEDAERNLEIHRMQKNLWSRALIGADACNAAACLLAAGYMNEEGWIETWGYLGILILESVFPALILGGAFSLMRSRKKKILMRGAKPAYVDDDIYWKNGWYSNPYDRRLFVQDWTCPGNYSMNMARPGAKVCTVLLAALTAGVLGVVGVFTFRASVTPIELAVREGEVEITSAYTGAEFGYDEIEAVKIIDSVPDDSYVRTNGMSDGKQNLGKFRGKKTGKCRMYLYVGYEPILEIRTAEGPVYVNSKRKGEVTEWFREIKVRTEDE